MDKNKRRGKLPFLPRVRSSYRQINRVFLILTWVGMLMVLTGPANAAVAPQTLPPVVGSNITSSAAGNTAKSSTTTASHSPNNNARIESQDTNSQTTPPEISFSIKAAEYVPPPPPSKYVPPPPPSKYVPPPLPNESSNVFPYGYCTWYVATKYHVTWDGNAKDWFANAAARGYKVGSTPAVGSIMVTMESYLGHVAYVEAVYPNGSWEVSEMNYAGWGIISQRIIYPGTIYVIGFIY